MVEEPSEVVPALLRKSRVVREVELRGSRAEGTATEYSDWDFLVSTDDFAELRAQLPRLLAPLESLVQQWDRLSDHACFMLIVPGPAKIDLIFEAVANDHEPPWRVETSTLESIDGHFWDWLLWLTSKAAKGNEVLVASELGKLHHHLLAPMGVAEVPTSLVEATDSYLRARSQHVIQMGVTVADDLERTVLPVIRRVAGN